MFLYYAWCVKGNAMLKHMCVSPSECFTSETDYWFAKKLIVDALRRCNVPVTSNSYSEGPIFESRPDDRLSLLTSVIIVGPFGTQLSLQSLFIKTHSTVALLWTLCSSELTCLLRVVNNRRHESTGSHDGIYTAYEKFILTFRRKVMPPSSRRLN